MYKKKYNNKGRSIIAIDRNDALSKNALSRIHTTSNPPSLRLSDTNHHGEPWRKRGGSRRSGSEKLPAQPAAPPLLPTTTTTLPTAAELVTARLWSRTARERAEVLPRMLLPRRQTGRRRS